MIELILELLVDIGFISADYKHRKRVRKKEEKDGIKRTFQKHLLQPSVIVMVSIIIIGIIAGVVFLTYQKLVTYPKRTEKEISKISEKIEGWNEKYGYYPVDLNELIGKNPLRQDWKTDAWNQPYKYIVAVKGDEFSLISAGSDGNFNTEDDIKSK
ncbi:type II secretion system protein GspG [Aquimarina sp. 2201CG5-10]|uniref:type II secretion system protein GspG n=1 Tax=Aquimarina callyspongiae TaxID=3098150 RepID=UPI002AB5D066|nr:type II secretion system protein GspG [Aquimarina sp. 2201CG5-10]MDY8135424.1 type II secretion system protein GspG [Aquimarina sp. 2201CG5-10]